MTLDSRQLESFQSWEFCLICKERTIPHRRYLAQLNGKQGVVCEGACREEYRRLRDMRR